MEHEIYIALVELNEKLDYIADILIKKGIMEKPKEEEKK